MGVLGDFIQEMGPARIEAFANGQLEPILDETMQRWAAKRRLNGLVDYFARDDAHDFLDTAIRVAIEQLSER